MLNINIDYRMYLQINIDNYRYLLICSSSKLSYIYVAYLHINTLKFKWSLDYGCMLLASCYQQINHAAVQQVLAQF